MLAFIDRTFIKALASKLKEHGCLGRRCFHRSWHRGHEGDISVETLPCPSWLDQASVESPSWTSHPKASTASASWRNTSWMLPAMFPHSTNAKLRQKSMLATGTPFPIVFLEQTTGHVSVMQHVYSPDFNLGRLDLEQVCHGVPHLLKNHLRQNSYAQFFGQGFQ